MKDKMESVCGMCCGDCKYLGDGCRGCDDEQGAPFWTGFVGVKVCPVYECCEDMKYEHCGCCKDMPCPKFVEIRDPEMTDEQVIQCVEDRKQVLLKRAGEMGKEV
ncbi:MAG TPA: DUF3795 domain-containing protein [Methanocella sp.]|nr:DUF3795 domain-containing protein [Methanocella sp.]